MCVCKTYSYHNMLQHYFVGNLSGYAPDGFEDSYRNRSVIDERVALLDIYCKCKNKYLINILERFSIS